MTTSSAAHLHLRATVEKFPFKQPFCITGYTIAQTDVLRVEVEQDGLVGRGEASGVYYKQGDSAQAGLQRLELIRGEIEQGFSRSDLQFFLPAGAARNALDCALWDLDAKRSAIPAWRIAGLEQPRALTTTFTIGAGAEEEMVATAREYVHARAIKLKLTGDALDAQRVLAVRAARPEVWLGVDANQGFTFESLTKLLPVLVEADVRLIEQPCKVGDESMLDDFESAIPFAADEPKCSPTFPASSGVSRS
jgi:L-alanine-DL-glutamate epimerase-like enolase superfamily enzyme